MASRKRTNLTNAFLRSIESFFSVSNEKVDGGEAVQKKRKEADLDGEVENEMKKITYYFLLHTFWLYCLLYYRRFPLLCIKRDAPCQLQMNCHFHFLNFPTVSSFLHIRKILVHWPFSWNIWPQKMGCIICLLHFCPFYRTPPIWKCFGNFHTHHKLDIKTFVRLKGQH